MGPGTLEGGFRVCDRSGAPFNAHSLRTRKDGKNVATDRGRREGLKKMAMCVEGKRGHNREVSGGVALVPPGTEVSSAFPLYPVPGLGFCAPAGGGYERQRPSARDFIKKPALPPQEPQ